MRSTLRRSGTGEGLSTSSLKSLFELKKRSTNFSSNSDASCMARWSSLTNRVNWGTKRFTKTSLALPFGSVVEMPFLRLSRFVADRLLASSASLSSLLESLESLSSLWQFSASLGSGRPPSGENSSRKPRIMFDESSKFRFACWPRAPSSNSFSDSCRMKVSTSSWKLRNMSANATTSSSEETDAKLPTTGPAGVPVTFWFLGDCFPLSSSSSSLAGSTGDREAASEFPSDDDARPLAAIPLGEPPRFVAGDGADGGSGL